MSRHFFRDADYQVRSFPHECCCTFVYCDRVPSIIFMTCDTVRPGCHSREGLWRLITLSINGNCDDGANFCKIAEESRKPANFPGMLLKLSLLARQVLDTDRYRMNSLRFTRPIFLLMPWLISRPTSYPRPRSNRPMTSLRMGSGRVTGRTIWDSMTTVRSVRLRMSKSRFSAILN